MVHEGMKKSRNRPLPWERAALLVLPLGLLAFPASAADPIPLPKSWALAAVDAAADKAPPEPRDSLPDFTREIERNKSYGIPAAEIFGFDFLLNQYDRRFIDDEFKSNLSTIRRNLRSSWAVDRDPFLVNQLGHPYQGSIYHGAARASGLSYWEASAYTFLGSAMWEIAGEATPPSRNDQINTGIGGSFFGEALFRMANLVLERDGLPPFWREIAAAVISPPTGFNRWGFGDRFRRIFPSRDPVYFTRLQLGFSGTAQNDPGVSTTKLKANEALADFFMDYGLPGKRGYEYTRPFDYFNFQATASSANGFENVMTRGLLAGEPYAVGKNYRGVWGLYGSYDYIAPQAYRVSSTALSLGTTGQWWATEKIAVQGTLMAGVGYAAAGTVRSSAESDFHYGAAPQALAALRFIFGERVAVDVTAREYYISRLGAAQRGGHENIARADVALTYRVRGPHGVTIKYLGNRRDANYPDIGGLRQQRQTIGIFYTFLGHDRFGAVEWR
jgi:hypothetical protein